MKISIFSIGGELTYQAKAVTFGDCSRVILPDHVDFSGVIDEGKIHILLADNSIITFINGAGIIVLTKNQISISCPKIFQSKEEVEKIKIQENLVKGYESIRKKDLDRFDSKTWVEEDPSIFKFI